MHTAFTTASPVLPPELTSELGRSRRGRGHGVARRIRAAVSGLAAACSLLVLTSCTGLVGITSRGGTSPSGKGTPTRANAVAVRPLVERDPSFQPDDSMRLARVKEAFARATAGDLAVGRCVPTGVSQGNLIGYAATLDRMGTAPHSSPEDRPHQLLVYTSGGKVLVELAYSKTRYAVEKKFEGLVWNRVDAKTFVFVTRDGGRYFLDEASLYPGAQAGDPLIVNYLDHLHERDVEKLVDVGELARPLLTEVVAARAAFEACNKPIDAWNAAQRRAIDEANVREETRENRRRSVNEESNARTQKQCTKHVDRMRAALLAAADARSANRSTL